jgi:hypothetical protein
MTAHNLRVSFRLSSPLLLSIGCCLFLTVPASAQLGDGAKVHMQEMAKRELQLSDVRRGSTTEADPRRARAIMDQVNEDFQHLLQLHNQIVRAVSSDDSLDYQFVWNATGEIKKRASRLQSTLGLRKPETLPASREVSDLQAIPTKDDLILLCRKIESFIKNPIVDTPGTVDAQQLERARNDLESVVQLSGVIKKRAEKQKR